ncbi:hypothetical protein P7K49_026021 [Saguinus oedipus]|uniref:Uncharacterized protein n=1 Tax=Saguinus oedipus TaxID=9490 RepID=A0ABQ9UIV5_SAGOE|nr:hypothetical protein P7K49_026021 [Saguinus oedipus]
MNSSVNDLPFTKPFTACSTLTSPVAVLFTPTLTQEHTCRALKRLHAVGLQECVFSSKAPYLLQPPSSLLRPSSSISSTVYASLNLALLLQGQIVKLLSLHLSQ